MVHVRVDEKTRQRARKALAGMSIWVSDAVRMLPVRVTTEKALPFDVKVPHATAVKAMRAAGRGKGKRLQSAGALLKDLGIRSGAALGAQLGAYTVSGTPRVPGARCSVIVTKSTRRLATRDANRADLPEIPKPCKRPAQFRRDVKLAQKRGKDMAKLREAILLPILLLKEGSPLPP
jgi:DNA-damage-inducible protein J